ncbi:MAG TPA: ABC transporter substrate-binding protein, partial [Burkholderiales bacterium]|nr:ABC transporter substrate-binding protein [Burkholderiales bacterium]
MRRVMKTALLVLALVALPAAAQDVAPDTLVKNVTLEVVDLIAKDKDIKAGSRAKLVAVIEAKVLPHFNFTAMTALAMGQN